MKKMTKALLAAGGAALICGGAVMTYLKAQTQQPKMSELTLTNIELLAAPCIDKMEFDGPDIKITVCNRDTGVDDIREGRECGTPGYSACVFTNKRN